MIESIRSLETVSLRSVPPEGLVKNPRLTFDEFFHYESQLFVKKVNSKGTAKDSSITEACNAMRSQSRKCRYYFSLACNQELDLTFRLPIMVEEIDLYTQFWSLKQQSNYLRRHNKIFSGYQKGYDSNFMSKYGGLSEWIQVISGEIKVHIFYPTLEHRARFHALGSDLFINDEKSSTLITMDAGKFIVIPGGCITKITATADTFTLSGQFLHYKNLKTQLEHFQEDALNANDKHILDRDREIRYLYWFMASNILTNRSLLTKLDIQSIIALHESLSRWNSVTISDLYKPPGLCTDFILKDMKSVICRGRRKAIELPSTS